VSKNTPIPLADTMKELLYGGIYQVWPFLILCVFVVIVIGVISIKSRKRKKRNH